MSAMDAARGFARFGRCARRQIACVIVDAMGTELAAGANGPVSGQCTCPGRDVVAGAGAQTLCFGMHAEQRALAQLERDKLVDDASAIYCTKAPCAPCVKLLLGTPIKLIVFDTPSNERENRELWEGAGRAWRQHHG